MTGPAYELRTILLIEDQRDIRDPYATALRDAAYGVVEAGSWDEALRSSESWRENPSLIVTDLVMPGDGTVATFLRLHERCERAPVLVVSAYPRAMRLLDGVLAGVVGWLRKPIGVDVLVRTVDDALEGRG